MVTPVALFCIEKVESVKSKNQTSDSMRIAQLLAAEWKSLSALGRSGLELEAGFQKNDEVANHYVSKTKVDANGEEDPKIAELVRMFNESYYLTSGSGDRRR